MINNLSASPEEKKGGKEEENSISVTTTQLFFRFFPASSPGTRTELSHSHTPFTFLLLRGMQ